MGIQSEIDRISGNIQAAVAVVAAAGIKVPGNATSDNLPSLVSGLSDMKQDKITYTTITLTASGWSASKTQTVTVNGVSADESAQLIAPTPAVGSLANYYASGIRCTGQAQNALTFTATYTPSADVVVYVVIMEVENA